MGVRELWLRVIRAAALSDHMGDMADGLNRISKVFDLDIPIRAKQNIQSVRS